MKNFATIALVFLLSSCATVFNRVNRPVQVDSTPTGLSIEIKDRDGKLIHTGTTPSTVTLSSKYGFFTGQSYTITARQGGRVVGTSQLNAQVSPWYFGNIVLGGLLGMVVIDPATGAMWTLPKSVHVGPAPLAAAAEGSVKILTLAEVPSNLRPKLVRI